jgi:hypothetical protein
MAGPNDVHVDIVGENRDLKQKVQEAGVQIDGLEGKARGAEAAFGSAGFRDNLKNINKAFAETAGAVLSWIGKLGLVGTALGLVAAAVNGVTEALTRKERKATESAQAMIKLAGETRDAFAAITADFGPNTDRFDKLEERAKQVRDAQMEAERRIGVQRQTPEGVQEFRDRVAAVEAEYQATLRLIQAERERIVNQINRANREAALDAEARKAIKEREEEREAADKKRADREREYAENLRAIADATKRLREENDRLAESEARLARQRQLDAFALEEATRRAQSQSSNSFQFEGMSQQAQAEFWQYALPVLLRNGGGR